MASSVHIQRQNGASLMVAFYISISFSILVSLSKNLLQSSF